MLDEVPYYLSKRMCPSLHYDVSPALFIPKVKYTTLGDPSFYYAGPTLWSDTHCASIHFSIDTQSLFKSKLQIHLFPFCLAVKEHFVSFDFNSHKNARQTFVLYKCIIIIIIYIANLDRGIIAVKFHSCKD